MRLSKCGARRFRIALSFLEPPQARDAPLLKTPEFNRAIQEECWGERGADNGARPERTKFAGRTLFVPRGGGQALTASFLLWLDSHSLIAGRIGGGGWNEPSPDHARVFQCDVRSVARARPKAPRSRLELMGTHRNYESGARTPNPQCRRKSRGETTAAPA
jgi:hypothetical protein